MTMRGAAFEHYHCLTHPLWNRNGVLRRHPGAEIRHIGARLVLSADSSVTQEFEPPIVLTEEVMRGLNALDHTYPRPGDASANSLVTIWGPRMLEDMIAESCRAQEFGDTELRRLRETP